MNAIGPSSGGVQAVRGSGKRRPKGKWTSPPNSCLDHNYFTYFKSFTVFNFLTFLSFLKLLYLLLCLMTQQLYSNYGLIEASKEGETEVVKLLLQNDKININLQNKYGYTALMWASYKGETEVVELLQNHKK